ncbi:Gfo/Idh/MocA family oxidoreductase, partial [Streptomyces violaceoruber]
MRIGVIGTGRIGTVHANTLSRHRDVGSLILTDADIARAQELAHRLGETAAPGVDEIFQWGVDAVVITTATPAHAELIGRAARSGLPVFCEKPIALDLPGTLQAIAEVEAAVQTHPAVAAGAVVVDDSAAGGRRLAAFVETARKDGGPAVTSRAQARTAAAEAVREAGAAVDGARLTDFLAALDDVAVAEMTRVLAASGVFDSAAARTAEEVGTALRATPRHRHIVRRWLRALAARDRLTHRDAD